MITEYIDGNTFIEDNISFLNTNDYLSIFFKLNAPRIAYSTKQNYVLKCEKGEKKLLTLKMDPYSTLFFGDLECVEEMIDYLYKNEYTLESYLCEKNLGDAILNELVNVHSCDFYEALLMDFMKATEIAEPSYDGVVVASSEDVDEIVECLGKFFSDCGLIDTTNKENVRENISSFRLIKVDGKIASMAKINPTSSKDLKIGEVYTRDEYRGKGYARKVVNATKNEILESGKNATLNVDRKNPISNHIYESLGFKKSFSQSEYRKR